MKSGLYILFLGIVLSYAQTVYSDLIETDLRVSGGWRSDRVATNLTAEDPKGFPFLKDHFKANELNI